MRTRRVPVSHKSGLNVTSVLTVDTAFKIPNVIGSWLVKFIRCHDFDGVSTGVTFNLCEIRTMPGTRTNQRNHSKNVEPRKIFYPRTLQQLQLLTLPISLKFCHPYASAAVLGKSSVGLVQLVKKTSNFIDVVRINRFSWSWVNCLVVVSYWISHDWHP